MASKNIIAKGTTYNGVESITLPTSPSGTATFYEISDTTAGASDVLNSKYFYTSSGVKTQGTGTAPSPTLITKSITVNGTYNASSDSADGYSSVTVNVSGGGGLVYESGTYEPTSDTVSPTISFTNAHTTLPIYVFIEDVSDTIASTNSILFWSIINHSVLYGSFDVDQDTPWYARTQAAYKSSTGGTVNGFNITSLTGTNTSALSYFLSTTGFQPYISTTRKFISGRTYKWIAVWAPTT